MLLGGIPSEKSCGEALADGQGLRGHLDAHDARHLVRQRNG
jgi:hypothetical protein